ncbi:dipeptide ABC transporter ATP-binding protein [Jiangella asiatica]|uniref:ABC transporter ATP-binding protein n=1 Tax=Jiangella asiatica TaxID=2530372 RepID=A0A4R5CVY7_9ACTN|nr:ABC transporter ATP-binding protein [Jiangella asiatica]TDE01973.1 ABC transporter ATP-binding protein [Jiangella asiatica]
MSGEPLLSVRDLRVAFRDRSGAMAPAANLSVDVPANGSLAVVGESGSGKTVSMRALLGLLPATAVVSGEAHFGGRDLIGLPEPELRKVRGPGIGMIFQNAMSALNPTRTLKVQLTEHLRWHGSCDRKTAVRRAVEALDRVGIPEPDRRIRMYPFQLSGGMRQRAMIAMSIVAGPRLLIADEPTTAVDVTIQRQVLDVLKQLRDDGLAIIMITHDLGVARYFCDDVVVMKDGRMVETATMKRFIADAREPYSRKLLDAAPDIDLRVEPDQSPAPSDRNQLLQARDLVKVFHGRGGDVHAVDDVSVTVGANETVGVVGESGSGKSTLARLLMRLVEPSSGEVTFDGHDLLAARRSELHALRRRVQMVFQNPYGSLLPHATVAANIVEPLRVHHVGTPAQRRARAVELLELVGIPVHRADQYPRQFSGGQQQRIAIARALALEPQLLVCDEPTSALDVSIQAQILDLLDDLKHRLGLSMLFITHNLAVAQRLCDRVVVMASGHIVESAPSSQLFAQPQHPYTRALLAAALPVRSDPPPWQPATSIDTRSGELVEVTPQHWVRAATPVPEETP